MKRILRYILYGFLFLLTIVLIWAAFNFSLVRYGWAQLQGQLHIINNSRPLTEVLADPNVPDSLKAKIRFIDVIATYAHDSLGLKRSENYTTLYDQMNKPILWTITACEKYNFKAYQWHFPVLGYVSYKGFFDYQTGFVEDSLLKLKGYDTDYGEVSAWSTLGWFTDPILSNMLYRSDGQLAELIIHEMTHATVYLKSSVDVNENLASMIGEEGAIRFLTSRFGKDSKELEDYLFRKADYDLFSQYMLTAHDRLDSLYKKINAKPDHEKEALKQKMIGEICAGLDSVPFHTPRRYSFLFKKRIPNNAYFMNFVRYDSQKEEMRKVLTRDYQGNILKYLKSFRDS